MTKPVRRAVKVGSFDVSDPVDAEQFAGATKRRGPPSPYEGLVTQVLALEVGKALIVTVPDMLRGREQMFRARVRAAIDRSTPHARGRFSVRTADDDSAIIITCVS